MLARRFFLISLVALLVGGSAARAGASPFVTVRDRGFVIGGRPFRFLGANASVMHGARERAALGPTLDAVVRDGGRVIRVWALGEGPEDAPPWRRDYAFRLGPSGFVDSSFAHLDAVLEAARARDLKVVVVLANRWHDYGGFPEYLRWAEPDVTYEPNGNVPRAALGRFYTSPRAIALYQEHVRRVVTRVSARTGLAYADDPTIFAWELANETSAQAEEDEDALVAWTRAQATFVKSLDPNHLVSAGHIGYDTERERATWLRVQALDEIDYADVHVYPLGDPRVRTREHLERYVADRVALAHGVLGKPLVFGEFGFDGDREMLRGRTQVAWVNDFLRAVSELGVAGALVWFYEPAETSSHPHAILATASRVDAPIRRTLRHAAASFAVPASPSVPGHGVAPVFTERTVLRAGRTHAFVRRGASYTISADALDFVEASFERADIYPGPPVAHLWGVGSGHVAYRIRAPVAAPPTRLAIRVFVSSELDGRGVGARDTETSRVRVTIDDVQVAELMAPVDDGVGKPVEIVIDDAALLARLFARPGRVHTLTLHASSRPYAGGLCIYGAVAIDAAATIDDAHERTSSLRIIWTRR